MREQRAERVAAEQDAVLRQPHERRIDRLAAGRREHLEAHAAELESVLVFERDVGPRDRLRAAEPAVGRRRAARRQRREELGIEAKAAAV